VPGGNDRFVARNGIHSVMLKVGSSDAYIDGVHYVLSFPIEGNGSDWLVSRMDTIKLFEPILRPTEISGRHAIRGVVIDAGHGGSDNGATSRLGNEKTYTLDTAYRLDGILRAAGLKTVFTRRTDVFVDLYERAHIASEYSDFCFVSIHFNSAAEEARGLETYCLSPRGAASTSSRYLTRGDIQKLPGNDYDPLNILLASMVHSEIIKLNPGDASADRGVKRARFVVIKQNVLPAILVEGGFVSNHLEAARVNRPDYRQSLAQAIARGVIKFANVMGDRRMSLPEENVPPAPKAMPVAVAPSGMASDSPPGRSGSSHGGNNRFAGSTPAAPAITPARTGTATPAVTGGSGTSTAGTTTAASTHKKKGKKAMAATAPTMSRTGPLAPLAPAPSLAPTPPENPDPTVAKTAADPSKSSGALNLAEPASPAPSPGAEKAPPEPDEPPTVNTMPPASGGGFETNAGSSSREP
jgi:N-acetylmuramoyl-L-alanine amidase